MLCVGTYKGKKGSPFTLAPGTYFHLHKSECTSHTREGKCVCVWGGGGGGGGGRVVVQGFQMTGALWISLG